MKQFICLLIAISLAVPPAVAYAQNRKPAASAEKKFYRWVDENGEVHYTESLPPDFQDKKADVLDDQGITRQQDISLVPPPPKPVEAKPEKGELPRDASGMQRPDPLYSPEQVKAQQDSLLMLRYDSEQEILDAMQVEINQLAYDERLLTTSRTSMLRAYRGNVREAAERQRAGKPVEPELAGEIQSLTRRLATNAESIAGLKQREQEIRGSFDANLKRYRELAAEYEDQG